MEVAPQHRVKVLVIRLSSMGDIVLTTPVVRALHTQLQGEVEIHFLTKQTFAFLLEANPRIARVHTFVKTVQEVLPDLVLEDFDYIIDLHNNIRSAVVKRRLKCLAFTVDKLNWQKWLLIHTGWNRMPDLHVVDRYMATLKAFGVKGDDRGLEYYIPQHQGLSAQQLDQLQQGDFLAVVIGGAHAGKRASADAMVQWLRGIQHRVVLVGGKDDRNDAERVAEHIQCINWVGELSVHQSAQVMQLARVVLTGDTGMMHIAAAFHRRIVSVWGCTSPQLGMAPYRPHPDSVVLEPVGRSKRPCSKLGNRCKYGMDHKCIDQIAPQQVQEAIERSWAQ